MPTRRLDFPNRRGQQLSGRLELPPGEPRAFALFAHCFTCSKDIAAATRISRALGARGLGVLRFDFTGLGNSEGDFANTNFSSNVEDLVAAADFLRQEYQAPRLLVGHSLGGAAVLFAAQQLEEVKVVATIAAPSSPKHLEKLLRDDVQTIQQQGYASVLLAGREFRIERQFLEDIERQDLREVARGLRKELIVFHSPVDNLVGIDHARQIFEAAHHPKSFLSLDQADHLLSRKQDSEFVANTLAAIAGRALSLDESPPQRAEVEEGIVRVESTGDRFEQRILAGKHLLTSDEPASVGGGDAGPTPYDLLLSGLGACTAMTLQMYARHKGIDLQAVRVDLSHRKIHASDCENCESETGKVDRIEREIELVGELSDQQRRRMLEIADRCPVHRTQEGEIEIRTKEV